MPEPTCESVADAVASVAGQRLAATLPARATLLQKVDVAGSPWLTPALAERLAKSVRLEVLTTLVRNPATPPATLAKLADHPDRRVSLPALTSPRCPFDKYATNPSAVLPGHPDCPAHLIEHVFTEHGPDSFSARYFLSHPNLPAARLAEALASTRRHTTRHELLKSPHLTHTDALTILGADPKQAASVDVWLWSAHHNADSTWLAAVADHCFHRADQGTIAHVASNPATLAATLADIVSRHAHRDYALENPSCPPSAMHIILDRAPDAARRFDDFGYWRLQSIIAHNPAATRDVLGRITFGPTGLAEPYHFARAHARTATQARTLLTLAPTWTGNLADLLDVSADLTD